MIIKETLKMVYKCANGEVPSYLACLFERLSESKPGNFGTPKPINVPCFYEQRVAKTASLLRRRNGLDANKNQQKISNNLTSVSKTPEPKGTLFIPADRSNTFNYLYFVILFCVL